MAPALLPLTPSNSSPGSSSSASRTPHVNGEWEAVGVGALGHDPDELVEVAVARP